MLAMALRRRLRSSSISRRSVGFTYSQSCTNCQRESNHPPRPSVSIADRAVADRTVADRIIGSAVYSIVYVWARRVGGGAEQAVL